jgi:hypothetical protein
MDAIPLGLRGKRLCLLGRRVAFDVRLACGYLGGLKAALLGASCVWVSVGGLLDLEKKKRAGNPARFSFSFVEAG